MFHKYCIFYKLKVFGSRVSSKSISTIFPTAFVHFMSLCHILEILSIFKTFSLLLYLLWWPVFSNLWCYYLIWGWSMNHTHIKMVNLRDKCWVCSDCSTDLPVLPLSLFSGLPVALRHNNIEIRPINNPTVASKCSSERKSCMSLTLNQKLEMMKLIKEGMSKE